MKKLLSTKELADYLSMKEETIRELVWKRKIPFFRSERLVRFDMEEIDKWLRERRHAAHE